MRTPEEILAEYTGTLTPEEAALVKHYASPALRTMQRETIEACAKVADKRYFAFHAADDIRALAVGEEQP